MGRADDFPPHTASLEAWATFCRPSRCLFHRCSWLVLCISEIQMRKGTRVEHLFSPKPFSCKYLSLCLTAFSGWGSAFIPHTVKLDKPGVNFPWDNHDSQSSTPWILFPSELVALSHVPEGVPEGVPEVPGLSPVAHRGYLDHLPLLPCLTFSSSFSAS